MAEPWRLKGRKRTETERQQWDKIAYCFDFSISGRLSISERTRNEDVYE
jgi:hypothetical protein